MPLPALLIAAHVALLASLWMSRDNELILIALAGVMAIICYTLKTVDELHLLPGHVVVNYFQIPLLSMVVIACVLLVRLALRKLRQAATLQMRIKAKKTS